MREYYLRREKVCISNIFYLIFNRINVVLAIYLQQYIQLQKKRKKIKEEFHLDK